MRSGWWANREQCLSLTILFHSELSQIDLTHSQDLRFSLKARDPQISLSTNRFSPALQIRLSFMTDSQKCHSTVTWDIQAGLECQTQTQHVLNQSNLPSWNQSFRFIHLIA